MALQLTFAAADDILQRDTEILLWDIPAFWELTQRGLVYTSKNVVVISSGNGLSPARRQAITWTWCIANWIHGDQIQRNVVENTIILLKEMHLKCRLQHDSLIVCVNSLRPSDA